MKKYMMLLAALVVAAGCEKIPEQVRNDIEAGRNDKTAQDDKAGRNGKTAQDDKAGRNDRTGQDDRTGLNDGANAVELTFAADAVATKTVLGDDWSVSWKEGDEVSILWKGGRAAVPAQLRDGKAYFSATVDEVAEFYAVYPSSIGASVEPDGRLNLQIPALQSGRFEDCAVIVSHTTLTELDFGRFHSAVSLIRFTLDDASLSRVRFSSPDGRAVAGTVRTDASVTAFTAEGTAQAIDVAVEGKGTWFLATLPGLSLPGLQFQIGTAAGWKGEMASDLSATLAAGDVLCLQSALDSHIVTLKDYYITASGAGSKDGTSAANAGDAALLRELLAAPDALHGMTLHVGEGTYDLSSGGKGMTLSSGSEAAFTIRGEEGRTVFTTSLSGAEGCILTVPSANVALTLEGITFTGGDHNGTGGALCLTAGKHIIRDCIFSDNKTTSTTADRTGGAVYVGGSATADFSGCLFERNKTAVTGGGAIGFHAPGLNTVYNCRFTRNGDKTIGNGGAILQKNADNTLYVVGCSFDSNACATNGPDIFSSAAKALLLYNCTGISPVNNSTGNLGFVRSNAPLLLANCTFSEATVGEANGCISFGTSGADKNLVVNNLIVCDSGNSFSSAFTASNPSLSRDVTSAGFNVFTKAPNINWKGDGTQADLTGITFQSLFSSPATLSEGGVMVWEGPAAQLPGFATAGAAAVQSAIKSYAQGGAEFFQWLTDHQAFAVDAAGNARGEDGWWPGAYQKP